MQSETVRNTVLREMVQRMGPDKLVFYDLDLLHALEARGLDGATISDVLDDLVNLALLEREADDLYRVTHDGEMTIPGAPGECQQTRSQPMTVKPSDLQRKEAARLRVLRAVYELTEGNPAAVVTTSEACERGGLAFDEGQQAIAYLEHERLLTGHMGRQLSITHQGVKEYEAALSSEGSARTRHFPASVIVQTFHGNVGSVQTGGEGNVAHVTQTAGVPSSDLASLVDALRVRAREHGDVVAVAAADKVHEPCVIG